jgi:hypothetical protein
MEIPISVGDVPTPLEIADTIVENKSRISQEDADFLMTMTAGLIAQLTL